MKDFFNHDKNTKINALLLLQRKELQRQLDKYEELLSKVVANEVQELSPSDLLLQRLEAQKKIVDEFEIILLSILDSDGRISTSTRMQDFLLVMTRVNKVDQRLACLYVLLHQTKIPIYDSFVQYGGLRLLKRWIKYAEEDESLEELKLILQICKVIPFDEFLVKETEIGKVIKKLLKYRSSRYNTEELSLLYTLVKEVMDLWTEKLKEVTTKSSKITTNTNTLSSTETDSQQFSQTMDLLESINERLFSEKQRQINTKQEQKEKLASSSSSSSATSNADMMNIIENKSNSDMNMYKLENPLHNVDIDIKEDTKSTYMSAETHIPTTISHFHNNGSNNNSNMISVTSSTSLLAKLQAMNNVQNNIIMDTDMNTTNSSSSHSSTSSSSTSSNNSSSVHALNNAKRGKEMMSDKAKKLLSDISEKSKTIEGSISGGSGIQRYNVVDLDLDLDKDKIPIKSVLKKKSAYSATMTTTATTTASLITDSSINTNSTITSSSSSSSSSNTNINTNTNTTANNIEKKGLKWADESGGELKEVRTFEVKNLKKSTSSYKNHRDLAKKERLLEKNTNVSKIIETMQPTVKWYKPSVRVLSFEMQEYACGPVESADIDIQNKRIAHTLEARYMDDSTIPQEPDDIQGIHELSDTSSSSLSNNTILDIPWIIPDNIEDQLATEEYTRKIHQMMTNTPMNTQGGGYDQVPYIHPDILNTLPEALRQLEPELIYALIQDESNIEAILNEDGTINTWKLEDFRMRYSHNNTTRVYETSNMNNDTHRFDRGSSSSSRDDYEDSYRSYNASNTHYDDYYTPLSSSEPAAYQYNDNMYPMSYMDDGNYMTSSAPSTRYENRPIDNFNFGSSTIGNRENMYTQSRSRSRWSAASSDHQLSGSSSSSMNVPSYSELSTWQGDMHPMDMDIIHDYPPYSADRDIYDHSSSEGGRRGMYHNRDNREYDRDSRDYDTQRHIRNVTPIRDDKKIPLQSQLSERDNRKRKMSFNKGKIPCRFFGTPQGCSFGDKCAFSHIIEPSVKGMKASSTSSSSNASSSSTSSSGSNNNTMSNADNRISYSNNINMTSSNDTMNRKSRFHKSNTKYGANTTMGVMDEFGREIR